MGELLDAIAQTIRQMWCGLVKGHEYECSEIEPGTFCDVNSRCKRCDKPRSY